MPEPDHRFSLTIENSTCDFQVLAFDGQEGVSTPHMFNIELVSEDASLDLEQLLHKSAFLAFDSQGAGIHGQIYRVDRRRAGDGVYRVA